MTIMATKTVRKEIKELIYSPGWKHIEKILKDRRDACVLAILNQLHSEEKVHSEADINRRLIRCYNGMVNIPLIEVEVEEEIKLEEEMNKHETLGIGQVEDLFEKPKQE